MNEEPSVLDYVKSRLRPKDYPRIELPKGSDELYAPGQIPAYLAPQADTQPEEGPEEDEHPSRRWPWLLTGAILLALIGQFMLGPQPDRSWALGAALLVGAVGLAVLSLISGEWSAPSPPQAAEEVDPPTLNLLSLGLGLVLSLLAFGILITGRPPMFGLLNLIPLIGGLVLAVQAVWITPPGSLPWRERLHRIAARPRWTITIDRPVLAGLAAVALVLFFRLYRLAEVPPEMNSDHAEKLLDILRVLNGQTLIFFPTNGGREALIFYLDAALNKYLGIPLGFAVLKTGSVLIGLAALPFIYGLGVELGGRRVGWLAFLMAGISYWGNVVSRFGLRLPFYFLFAAATIYFIVRGFRSGRRNEFVYAGVSLGLGFYGYTPDRLLPLVVLLAFGLYVLHHRDRDHVRFSLLALMVVAVFSFILFVPLLSYIFVDPSGFLARTLTRMSDAEHPLEVSPWVIFFRNFGRALAMFSWDDGEIWPVSVPHYPALGFVSGALFYIGLAILVVRYIQKRHWLDLFIVLSIPFLLLPSVLSLAFPAENPNLYRTGGAIVPVFLMAATALEGLMSAIRGALRRVAGQRVAWAVALILIALMAMQEYTLVFDTFFEQYRMSAWNSSEMGAIAAEFAETMGSPDTIWVMGSPHWVDSRLVAVHAGFPGRDYRMFPEDLAQTQEDTRAKLFFLKPDDEAGIAALRGMYPHGWLSAYTSKVPTKDFLLYFVPPEEPQAGQ